MLDCIYCEAVHECPTCNVLHVWVEESHRAPTHDNTARLLPCEEHAPYAWCMMCNRPIDRDETHCSIECYDLDNLIKTYAAACRTYNLGLVNAN